MKSRQFAWAMAASACALSGCESASRDRDLRCEWHGTGAFANYATRAEAKLVADRLVGLRIVSKVGTIPDSSAGTCVYELPEARIEYISDDASKKRLRLIDERNEGIGYLRYRVTGNRLSVESIDSTACEEGRIEFPIDMGPSPGDCRVGPPGMR
ncbi:MAG: hypothetical protein IT473_05035 [Lysobacter sp.]|nr:hypothetical protein [Lysobacter sp.]